MASAIRCSLVALLCLCFVTLTRTHEANEDLVSLLQSSISGKVFPKGSYGYAKRRIVHNGLCSHIFPDIIVTPHTTEDVSAIVKIARAHNQVISVRSGGHSFTCTSLKQGKHLTSYFEPKVPTGCPTPAFPKVFRGVFIVWVTFLCVFE